MMSPLAIYPVVVAALLTRGCHGTSADCQSCLAGGRVWCPKTATCHNSVMEDISVALPDCTVPINTIGECWGQACPNQIGGMLNNNVATYVAWAAVLTYLKMDLIKFPVYNATSTGVFDLATNEPLADPRGGGESSMSNVTVVATADWGSGTCEAETVSKLMNVVGGEHVFHLGDVYYSGLSGEFETNVLGKAPSNKYQHGVSFPKGTKGTFLMNGNHEMVSGGEGLLSKGFAYTGQSATYGAWQNDYWRLISLDTGYLCYKTNSDGSRKASLSEGIAETDAPLPEEMVSWLQSLMLEDDNRGIVLLSHHQPYSGWESAYLGAARQLNDLLRPGRKVIWLFGHEHRLAFYKGPTTIPGTTDFSVYPRMVGNGGFSDEPIPPVGTGINGVNAGPEDIIAYDGRIYQKIPATTSKHSGSATAVSFNGFFKMNFAGPHLAISYVTTMCVSSGCQDGLNQTHGIVVAQEKLDIDLSNGDLTQNWTYIGTELTKGAANETQTGEVDTGVLDPSEVIIENCTGANCDKISASIKCIPRAHSVLSSTMMMAFISLRLFT